MPGQNSRLPLAAGQLRVGFWNIHGHKSTILGNKLKLTDVIKTVERHDIFSIVETHANAQTDLSMKDFKCYRRSREVSGVKQSGGIALYISKKIKDGVEYIPSNNRNMIWCKIKKNYFNIERDIFLGTAYFSPENFEKAANEDYLFDLEENIAFFATKGDIVIQGDLNSRTGSMNECILHDDDKYLTLPSDYECDVPLPRNSEDEVTNTRGKSLVELCSANNMRIANGRTVGDLFGKKTCFQYNGSSLVDYVICSSKFLSKMKFLKIHDLQPHISDHCSISFDISAETLKRSQLTPTTQQYTHQRLLFQDKNKHKINEIINSEEYQTKLNNVFEDSKDHELTGNFTKLLIEISDKAGMKYQKLNNEARNKDPEWFDDECQTEKQNLKSLGKKVCRLPKDTILRRALFKRKKNFKNVCKRKKNEYMNVKIKNLDFKNAKNLWGSLKSTFGIGKQNTQGDCAVEIEDLYAHFKNLNDGKIEQEIPSKIDIRSGPLDTQITLSEVNNCIKKLKNRKAPGHDNILNELLKEDKETLPPLITRLFNKIFSSGYFPEEWNLGFIIPIFKKGERTDADNYRGITLLSCLSKLFTSVLNERLYDHLVNEGIMRKEQGGFRKNHSTTDSMFSLKSIIDRVVKGKPKKRNNMLFTCFVDFQKAFDSVPRHILFSKILNAGITGRFYEILYSMYTNDWSVVKKGNKITDRFRCTIGVKQGCMLSPTLFNLFLSDLPEFLSHSNAGHQIGDVNINCFLYADDLVIFSETRNGLQRLLNKLDEYSNINKLKVNITKTKIMIFNNNGKVMNNYKFYLNDMQLENVRTYKYLGLTFSTFGNFTIAKQELQKTALKALFKLKRDLGSHFRTDVKLTLKLYETLIVPILLYGSEIWGADNKHLTKENDPLERVNTKFCKMLLGTNKTSVNNACRGELGIYPIKLKADIRMTRHWTKIITKHDDTMISKIIYTDCINKPKQTFWSEKVKRKLYMLGFGFIWLMQNNSSLNIERFLNEYTTRLKDIEYQNWLGELFNDRRKKDNQRNKLRSYRIFKKQYELENYLISIKNIKHRITLTRLRISDHNLMIEKGRHTKPYTTPEKRICPTCKNDVEDEFHFIIKCPTYKKEREDFQQLFKKHSSEQQIFLNIINPQSKSIAHDAAKFIFDCTQTRKEKISCTSL